MTNMNKFPFVTNLRATAVVMVLLYECIGIYILLHILLQSTLLSPELVRYLQNSAVETIRVALLLLLVYYARFAVARRTPFNKLLGLGY